MFHCNCVAVIWKTPLIKFPSLKVLQENVSCDTPDHLWCDHLLLGIGPKLQWVVSHIISRQWHMIYDVACTNRITATAATWINWLKKKMSLCALGDQRWMLARSLIQCRQSGWRCLKYTCWLYFILNSMWCSGFGWLCSSLAEICSLNMTCRQFFSVGFLH